MRLPAATAASAKARTRCHTAAAVLTSAAAAGRRPRSSAPGMLTAAQISASRSSPITSAAAWVRAGGGGAGQRDGTWTRSAPHVAPPRRRPAALPSQSQALPACLNPEPRTRLLGAGGEHGAGAHVVGAVRLGAPRLQGRSEGRAGGGEPWAAGRCGARRPAGSAVRSRRLPPLLPSSHTTTSPHLLGRLHGDAQDRVRPDHAPHRRRGQVVLRQAGGAGRGGRGGGVRLAGEHRGRAHDQQACQHKASHIPAGSC